MFANDMNTKLAIFITLALIGSLFFLGYALAAGETLPRTLFASGGGSIREAGLNINLAIGQPVIGTVSRDSLRLCSGFYCGLQTVTSIVYLPLSLR